MLFRNTNRWARITKAGSDDKQFATQQLEYMGKVADALMVFPYGFHANISPDALVLMSAIGDDPENRAAIGGAAKNRPTLAEGEVAFYHPPTDAFIIWRDNGDLEIETGNGGTADINITTTTINITADVNIIGNTTFTGEVTANGKDIGDTHGHAQGSDSNGDTQANISGVT